MVFDLKDVRRVLDAFADGSWDHIHLRDDDSELLLSVHPVSEMASTEIARVSASLDSASVLVDPSTVTSRHADPEESSFIAQIADSPRPDAARVYASTDDVDIPIVASSLGIFWRKPSPISPPFVSVGDLIHEETTVCIVEVMKLMQYIKAGVAGSVTEVLAVDGQTIVAGQVLFRIKGLS